MKEWKGLIAGLLLGVLATLAIGAAATESNGRYQLKVIVWRDAHGRDYDVKEYMLDTRSGALYYCENDRWRATAGAPGAEKPNTDSDE